MPGFNHGLSANTSGVAHPQKAEFQYSEPGTEKVMFAMRGNPYLNTPLHRTKGIKS